LYTGRNDKTLTDDDKGAGAMILFLVHGKIKHDLLESQRKLDQSRIQNQTEKLERILSLQCTSGMRFSEVNKVNY